MWFWATYGILHPFVVSGDMVLFVGDEEDGGA